MATFIASIAIGLMILGINRSIIESAAILSEDHHMLQPWWKSMSIYNVYIKSFKDSNGDGIGDLNGKSIKLNRIERYFSSFILIN